MNKETKRFILGVFLGMLILGAFVAGAGVMKIIFKKSEAKLVEKTRELVSEESVVTRVVEEVTSGVVTISISKTQIDFLSQFFGDVKEEKIEQDVGTGFIIDDKGLIVTNKHVVGDRDAKYKVIVGKDEELEVKDIYRDPVTDLAILKVEKEGLRALRLGDSDSLKVGQSVIAIGTALGEFRSTVTTGVISGLGRGITAGSPFEGAEELSNVIQTDAAINPGNSGGPLLNSNGEVIGVNVAVSASGQNIGFALPINLVKKSIDNFTTTGEFERPYLGVAYQMISKEAAILNSVPQGAYLSQVAEEGPGGKAGLKAGDIITEIDGVKLDDESETSLIEVINNKKIGNEVEVIYFRDKETRKVNVKLEKRAG
jgi:S1-C subfamily serine protease